MESVSTPRISASMLDSYVDRNVIVVGKVTQLRGESALLDANGQVNLILNRETRLMAGNGAQIIGKVNPDLSIRVYNALDLGDNVDYQIAQSVVDITHQHKQLFVYDNQGGWSASSLPATSSSIEPESQQRPHAPSPQQPHFRDRNHRYYRSQTPSQPATAADYDDYSSSTEAINSSPSLNDGVSSLAAQSDISSSTQPANTRDTQSSRLHYNTVSTNRPSTAGSRRSSLSEAFNATSSLDDELSRLVIEHDEPPASQSVVGRDFDSPVESSSSTTSLDHDTLPVRHVRAASYCSSSSEGLGSISDPEDGTFSELADEEETPLSSNSISQSTQPQGLGISNAQPTRGRHSSIHEHEVPSPRYGSPSSTGKLSNKVPSPVQPPTRITHSSSTRSSRLYRTRSGSLVSITELRQRREREEELLDSVLKGIVGVEETGARPSQHSIAMTLDESGRWRIDWIVEPWGL